MKTPFFCTVIHSVLYILVPGIWWLRRRNAIDVLTILVTYVDCFYIYFMLWFIFRCLHVRVVDLITSNPFRLSDLYIYILYQQYKATGPTHMCRSSSSQYHCWVKFLNTSCSALTSPPSSVNNSWT